MSLYIDLLNDNGKVTCSPGTGCIAGLNAKDASAVRFRITEEGFSWDELSPYVNLILSTFVRPMSWSIEKDNLTVKFNNKLRIDELTQLLVSLRMPIYNWELRGEEADKLMQDITWLSTSMNVPKYVALIYLMALGCCYKGQRQDDWLDMKASPRYEDGHHPFNMWMVTHETVADMIKRAYKFGGIYKVFGFQGRIKTTHKYKTGISVSIFPKAKSLAPKLNRIVEPPVNCLYGTWQKNPQIRIRELVNTFNTEVNKLLPDELKLKML